MKKAKILSAVLAAAMLLAGCSESIESKLETADSYMSDKDYEEAVEKYEEILDDDHENVDAYLGLAKAYEKMGDYDKAFEILEEGIEKTDDKSLKKRLERVQDENITSADSAANSLRTLATTFVTNASNLQKATLRMPDSQIHIINFIVKDGKWTSDDAETYQFGDGSKVHWIGDDGNDKDTNFNLYMEREAVDYIKNGCVAIALEKGCVTGLAVRQGTLTTAIGIQPADWKAYKTAIFPDKPGIDTNNQIIGTNPKLDKAD